MNRKYKFIFLALLAVAVLLLLAFLLRGSNIAVLNPKGEIAEKQRDLINIATWLMMIVMIPVFILTVVFAWKYREKNTKAKYSPDWHQSLLAESIWWGIPGIIILILGIITWKSCRELDPFKPLQVSTKPIAIQVVALQWKWLFIYPEYKIATVNFIQFPEKTPLNFEITSDAPMNSFWIPQLGGQIYAMPGMRTKIHLIANETGSFKGLSANLSGRGFAGMKFTANASSQADFDRWMQSVKQSPNLLTLEEYNRLVEPSENSPQKFYLLQDETLYDQIIMKYMMPMP